MHIIQPFLLKLAVLAGAILIVSALNTLPVRALDNPVNPNASTPNSGVVPGHRPSGDFASKRPGNLPPYGGRAHAYTGVTSKTP